MGWSDWWTRWWQGKVVVETTPTWQRYFGLTTVQEVLRLSVQEISSSKQGRSVGKLVRSGPDGELTVFLKRHYRLPVWQRLAALLGLGRSSALHEWGNLRWACSAGFAVPEALAAGEQIGPGLHLQSFLAVRGLDGMLPLHKAIPLAWKQLSPDDFRRWKAELLQELGQLIRRLHETRRFHKDLYLCHFYIPGDCLRAGTNFRSRIYLIDLHRMRPHQWVVQRWRVKDLAQLKFSMTIPGLEPNDWFTFFHAYLNRDTLRLADERFLRRILRKAERYRQQNVRRAARQPKQAWQLGHQGTPQPSFEPHIVNTAHPSACGQPTCCSSANSAPSPSPGRRALRIALCYDKVYPARGGMEVFIVDLIRRLVRDGHEVHLFAWQRDAQALPATLVFHPLPMRWMPRFLRPWDFGRCCERALQGQQFDVVVGFVKTWCQDMIILGGGLHVANAEHNLLKYRQPWARALARLWRLFDICYWSYLLLERKQFTRGYRPLVVAVSHMVKQHCQEYYHIPASQIRVLHAAIDPERFMPHDRERLRNQARHELGIAPDEPVALFVGHNYSLKGLVPLLRAMQVLRGKPLHLLVCGSRKDAVYRRLAIRLGVDKCVHFLGYQSDVRRCFFASDFVVHPTFYDPCSLVVMEALACGLPIITTKYNGAAELLHPPQDGFILDDPHDYWRLAEYLDLLAQADIRRKCSEQARLTATRWTLDHLYQALLDVFYEVAARKQIQVSPSQASQWCERPAREAA